MPSSTIGTEGAEWELGALAAGCGGGHDLWGVVVVVVVVVVAVVAIAVAVVAVATKGALRMQSADTNHG